jgi:hypothetical protein
LFISFDPAVDMEVDGGKPAIRFLIVKDLYAVRLGLLVAYKDLLADERHRGLVESAVEADGSVFGHFAPGRLAEIIVQVFRGGP